jgi:hypothetical protein
MLFKEIIAVSSGNHTKSINKLYGQTIELKQLVRIITILPLKAKTCRVNKCDDTRGLVSLKRNSAVEFDVWKLRDISYKYKILIRASL